MTPRVSLFYGYQNVTSAPNGKIMELSSPIEENHLIQEPKILWPIHDHVSAITVITNVIAQCTF